MTAVSYSGSRVDEINVRGSHCVLDNILNQLLVSACRHGSLLVLWLCCHSPCGRCLCFCQDKLLLVSLWCCKDKIHTVCCHQNKMKLYLWDILLSKSSRDYLSQQVISTLQESSMWLREHKGPTEGEIAAALFVLGAQVLHSGSARVIHSFQMIAKTGQGAVAFFSEEKPLIVSLQGLLKGNTS